MSLMISFCQQYNENVYQKKGYACLNTGTMVRHGTQTCQDKLRKKLTVCCALWAGGIIGQYFKNDEGHNVTVNGDRYRAMITNFFIPELNNNDVQELWFQQDGATCHTARATIDLLKDTLGDRLISRFGPVNWPPTSCDLTPLDYFLWGYVKSLVYVDKPQTLDHLEDIIRRVIADIRPQMLEKVIENWTSRLDYIRSSRGSYMPEIIFKIGYDRPTWSYASTSVHHFTGGQANWAHGSDGRPLTSRTIAQHIESATHHSVSARIIRHLLQQSGLFARRPLLGLPLTQNHRRLLHQWCDEIRMWTAEWNEVVFTDESRMCLQHHDGWIRVWRHRGERMLNSCVMHRHTGPAQGIMVWGGIAYHSRTPLVRIAGTLNSQRNISKVLEPVVLPYLPGLATAIFQQDNFRPHGTRIVQMFFVNPQIELLPWPTRSLDLSPIENLWSMVAKRLTQITSPDATSDQLWQRVEASLSVVSQEHIQSVFEPMPRRVVAVISKNGG
ncbi:transposable element Tcb1 transposase [Trichonephila clavipes]|nr:transposable element Tcb1 transposase [Trichonephila clavipes]